MSILYKRRGLPFKAGCWLVTCDRCGDWLYNTEVRKEWTGYIVCLDCIDIRNPIETEKIKTRDHKLPFTRPPTPIIE